MQVVTNALLELSARCRPDDAGPYAPAEIAVAVAGAIADEMGLEDKVREWLCKAARRIAIGARHLDLVLTSLDTPWGHALDGKAWSQEVEAREEALKTVEFTPAEKDLLDSWNVNPHG